MFIRHNLLCRRDQIKIGLLTKEPRPGHAESG